MPVHFVDGNDEIAENDVEIGEELFKHLSYLSQLNNEVKEMQHVDVGGPGEYSINVFDADQSSASPSSASTLNLM